MGSFDIFFTIPISRKIPIRKPACSRLSSLSGHSQFQRDAWRDRGNLGGLQLKTIHYRKPSMDRELSFALPCTGFSDAPLRLLSF
jgi:hypothetical protein